MEIKRIAPDDYWMLAANLAVAVIVFAGVYLMNMKGIGNSLQFLVEFFTVLVALP